MALTSLKAGRESPQHKREGLTKRPSNPSLVTHPHHIQSTYNHSPPPFSTSLHWCRECPSLIQIKPTTVPHAYQLSTKPWFLTSRRLRWSLTGTIVLVLVFDCFPALKESSDQFTAACYQGYKLWRLTFYSITACSGNSRLKKVSQLQRTVSRKAEIQGGCEKASRSRKAENIYHLREWKPDLEEDQITAIEGSKRWHKSPTLVASETTDPWKYQEDITVPSLEEEGDPRHSQKNSLPEFLTTKLHSKTNMWKISHLHWMAASKE